MRKGDGVLPTTGGVAVRETGGVGFLIAGLSHEEKKSSSGSPAGVFVPSPASVPSVMTTSSGYLDCTWYVSARQARHIVGWGRLLLGVPRRSLLQLLLVLGRNGRVILGLRVLAVQGGRSSVLLEKFGG